MIYRKDNTSQWSGLYPPNQRSTEHSKRISVTDHVNKIKNEHACNSVKKCKWENLAKSNTQFWLKSLKKLHRS